MKKLLILLLCFPGILSAGNGSLPIETIDLRIKEYEEKLIECEKTEAKRASPGEMAINSLRKFSEDNVRKFLVSTSAISLHNCTMPEIGELSFIVGAILESDNVSENTKKYAAEKQYLVHVSSWGFYQHLNDLPTEMKSELSRYGYFEKPFDALKILEQLGIL